MSRDISSSDDIIDSRNVIERIAELEEEREALAEAVTDAEAEPIPEDDDAVSGALARNAAIDEAKDALATWEEDYGSELKALKALESQAEGYSDWSHGATLIRDSYFEDYAQQTAEELGLIPEDGAWPCTCIDWEKAALELQMDYTSVEFDGTTYWIR